MRGENRKYFVESLGIVPSNPRTPNRRIAHRPDMCNITKKASRSSKNGVSVIMWKQGKFGNVLPYLYVI